MKEKVTYQVENMKRQTIGVEVEMNRITRRRAAKIAADFFGTGRYGDTAHINGYHTWSTYDVQGREWKFSRDVSITASPQKQCELITPILTYNDITTLQELLRALRHAGGSSTPQDCCGVHVHIGRGDHTPRTIRNLVNLVAAHEDQFIKVVNVDKERIARYCKKINPVFLEKLNVKKPDTFEKLADIWYEGNNADFHRNHHYNRSRYYMLNLHALFTKGTIEFRFFQFDNPHDGKQGGIHAGQIKAYIQLCLALSEFAKEVRYVSPIPQNMKATERYAFQRLMLRLGFVGDEFSTARSLLVQNLPGKQIAVSE